MITLLKQLVMKMDIGSLPITAFDHPLFSDTDKDKALKWWNELSDEQKTKDKESAPSQPVANASNREVRATLVSIKGERCCFKIFNPQKLTGEAKLLCEKEPRFNFRAAISRDESLGVDRLAK